MDLIHHYICQLKKSISMQETLDFLEKLNKHLFAYNVEFMDFESADYLEESNARDTSDYLEGFVTYNGTNPQQIDLKDLKKAISQWDKRNDKLIKHVQIDEHE